MTSVVEQLLEGQGQGDAGGVDRGDPRPAVGLDDVAVEDDLPLADGLQVRDGPERPPDEALDLLAPAGGIALGPFPGGPFLRGAGEHGVFGRDPARARVAEERRDFFLDRRRGDDPGLAHLDEGRAVGEIEIIGLDVDRAQVVGFAVVVISCVVTSSAGRVFQRLWTQNQSSGRSRISCSIILVHIWVIFNTSSSRSAGRSEGERFVERHAVPALGGGLDRKSERAERPS